jgi:hypothetical protein
LSLYCPPTCVEPEILLDAMELCFCYVVLNSTLHDPLLIKQERNSKQYVKENDPKKDYAKEFYFLCLYFLNYLRRVLLNVLLNERFD